MIRQPAVAGLFYPAEKAELINQVSAYLRAEEHRKTVTAVVLPHAGYLYSGHVAGAVVGRIAVPEQVILLGPNHYGRGGRIAVSGADGWHTPAATVPLAGDLRSHLLDCLPGLSEDDRPHRDEHSLEVLLPFLLHCQPRLRIVPIALNHQLDCADCLELGSALARAVNGWPQPVLLVASSDMNHFLPAQENAKLDALALAAMTDFDPQRLYRIVHERRISMCGVAPVVTVMQAARLLGASHCRLVRYAHSGESSGDNSRVVGYAGLILD